MLFLKVIDELILFCVGQLYLAAHGKENVVVCGASALRIYRTAPALCQPDENAVQALYVPFSYRMCCSDRGAKEASEVSEGNDTLPVLWRLLAERLT